MSEPHPSYDCRTQKGRDWLRKCAADDVVDQMLDYIEELERRLAAKPPHEQGPSDYEAWGHLYYFPSNWGEGYVVRTESGNWNGHNPVASQPVYTRKSEDPTLPGKVETECPSPCTSQEAKP